jgi:hypothetical protein
MRRVVVFSAVMARIVALGALVWALPVMAAPNSVSPDGVYLIPANDGYGVAECITSKRSCGRIVADAWCQNHGYKTALSFGVADKADFTGSVPVAASGSSSAMPLVVHCGK